MKDSPVIIEAAINEATQKARNSHVPIEPSARGAAARHTPRRVTIEKKHARAIAALAAMLLGGTTVTPGGAFARPEIRQDQLDADERVPQAVATKITRVLHRNRAYLGASPIEFCRKMSTQERATCISEIEDASGSQIAGVIEIEESSRLQEGGRDWPNAGSVSEFRRLRLSVPLAIGARTARHEANMVSFRSARGEAHELCVFPLEHWSWSAMERPERFSHAPVGICGDREQTVTEYLLEQEPDAAPVVLRFLSEPEARAWQARDPERIKWDSPYTAGHPYAKYFLLDSLRWWRGGRPPARREGYAWAVRIPRLPLSRIRELEKSGDVFLDIFEDGAQIELTNVTKEGLVALLAEKPDVLVDHSGSEDTAPRFKLLGD